MIVVTKKVQVLIYDIGLLLLSSVIAFVLYKQSWISMTQLFIGIIGCLILCTVFLVCNIVYVKIKAFIHALSIKRIWLSLKNSKIMLVCKLIWILRKKYSNRILESTFVYFVHYYNTYCNEITNTRKFPKEEFPEGTYSVVKEFVYITRIRAENQQLLSEIDFVGKRPTLYGTPFDRLIYKISNNFELNIQGIDDGEVMTYEQQRAFETRCKNAMENLDTTLAEWLIRNRAHFGF